MTKAILLLDEMPKRCIDCPCMYMIKNSHYCKHYCKATIDKDCYREIENICERSSWCPLKLMPQHKEAVIKKQISKCACMSYLDEYAAGWNDCLNEIKGETE